MLSLLRAVPLTRLPLAPERVPERWSAHGHLCAPGQRGLAIADGDRHLVLASAAQQWQLGARVGVPAEALAAALAPDLRHLALLQTDGLEVHPLDGASPLRRVGLDAVPATPALSFDVQGDALWLSGEHAEGHLLQLFDTGSLTPLATASVAGEREGVHDLLPHPHAPAVAVSVSCGQDGTWLTLLQRSNAGLEKVGELASEDEPFYAAGFLPDGESFVGIANTWVRRWSYPGCQLLAEHLLPEDLMAGFTGVVLGNSVLVPVEHEEGGPWRLHQLDAQTLHLKRRLKLPLRSAQVPELQALPGGYLLAQGHLWRLPPEVAAGGR